MIVKKGETVPDSLAEALIGQESPVLILGETFPGRIIGVEILKDSNIAQGVEICCEFEIPDDHPIQQKLFQSRLNDFSVEFLK